MFSPDFLNEYIHVSYHSCLSGNFLKLMDDSDALPRHYF